MITMKIKRVAELITNDENEHIYMRMNMQPTPSWYVLCTDTANWTLVKGKEADRLEYDWYDHKSILAAERKANAAERKEQKPVPPARYALQSE
jgi:hypothetical protein